jgi:uncharacterized protein (TIGR02147 family)
VGIGLLERDDDTGELRPTTQNISTGDEIASLAVVRYHQKMIELGKESITTIDEDMRDIGAITASIDHATMLKMKSEIQLFRKKLLAVASGTKQADTVYQLNMQFFPVTKSKGLDYE